MLDLRFIVDVNLSPLWATLLETDGIHAEHWTSIGEQNAPDSEVIAHVLANDAVLLTHDLDFGAILAFAEAAGPSVVQIRGRDVDPRSIGTTVVLAIRQHESALLQGAILTVDVSRAKVRLLPIRR